MPRDTLAALVSRFPLASKVHLRVADDMTASGIMAGSCSRVKHSSCPEVEVKVLSLRIRENYSAAWILPAFYLCIVSSLIAKDTYLL